jgi:hypothetical protein
MIFSDLIKSNLYFDKTATLNYTRYETVFVIYILHVYWLLVNGFFN